MRLLLTLLVVAGCAKREPPSGGPPDLEPPRLIGSVPDSGAARVPLDASLSLTFSEPMEPRSTGDAVALAPRVDIRQRRWSGRTVTLVLAQPLHRRQTYVLFLGSGARDRHGNPMVGGAAVVFSTADSFPPGLLEGEVEARGFAAAGTFLWCYDASTGHEPDSTARDFDALGLSDAQGRFRIAGLPVPGRYRLWAFADLNGNRSFEPAADLLVPVDSTFALTSEQPEARGLVVRAVNPRAPGRVRGAVLDSLRDSLGVIRIRAEAASDTTRRLLFDVDAQGAFDFKLPPGRWRLRAFRDLDRNRSWQPALEPASGWLEIGVEPAAEVRGLTLILQRPGGRP